MPSAHLEEGSNMRVHSITSITSNQQHSPHATEYTGISPRKTTSGITFEEYLKKNIEKINAPTVTCQTENQLAGLLMGYFTPLRMTNRDEPKTENNAS